MAKASFSRGFSVLELTMSLTVIAMLVAAVTTGASLKHSLELSQVVDDISNITRAVSSFRSTYIYYPGDFPSAEERLGSTSTDDGNGNGFLGTSEGVDTNTNETLLFWQHLQLAGLIEGSYDGATNGIGGLMQGPLKYSVFTVTKASGGLMTITVSKIGSAGGAPGYGLFTTKEAFDYDGKYDDNNPTTGTIRASDGTGETAGDCVSGGAYNLTNTSETPCVVSFQIEQNP